jgi:hypothetical protein
MEQNGHKKDESAQAPSGPPVEPGQQPDTEECRCKEAQGKSITDFIKVMLDDLAFWRRKP